MKLSVFNDDMILCVENSTDFLARWLELANTYGRIAGSKINTKILYTLTMNYPKKEIKKTIPCILLITM